MTPRMTSRELVNVVELKSVALDSCEVTRGAGQPGTDGPINTRFEGQVVVLDDGTIECQVRVLTEMFDGAKTPVATFRGTFLAAYDATDTEIEWDEDMVAMIGREAVSHAAPFVREFLSDMTSKMNLPRYLLPLVRSKDLSATVNKLENTGDH